MLQDMMLLLQTKMDNGDLVVYVFFVAAFDLVDVVVDSPLHRYDSAASYLEDEFRFHAGWKGRSQR